MIRSVELGFKGISQLLSDLDQMKGAVMSAVVDSERELGQAALEILDSNVPRNEIDGNLPPSMDWYHDKYGFQVSLEGEDVAYIEFGTGIYAQSSYPDQSIIDEVGWIYDINNHGHKGWWYTHKLSGVTRIHSFGMEARHPLLTSAIETAKIVRPVVMGVLREKFAR